MSKTKSILSPKTLSGAVIWSLVVHAGVVASGIGWTKWGQRAPPPAEDFIDLSYQTFEEPPPIPEEKVQKVRNSPTPVTEPVAKTPQDDTPKELQDENSDIAGTQKKTEETNVGSNNNGSGISTPYYKIKPKYPKAALISGVEGWVLMEVDINETGAVENIRVLDGEQRNMFQSDAKRALSQWKFRPFLDKDGNPIRKTDYQVRIDFKLEDAEATSM